MNQPLTDEQLGQIEARVTAARHCPNAEANGRLDGQHTLRGTFSHIRCELCTYTRPRGERVEETAALLAEVHRLRTQRRVLLNSIARKDAASGAGDRALREFLSGSQEASRAPRGSTPGGQHTATVAITVTAPTDANADSWAETIADLAQAEYGDTMRLDIRLNPPTLPRHGDWKVTRGGVTVHTAATEAEAKAVGTYAIRQETDPTARVEWMCPACYGDDQECQDCSDGTQWYWAAHGVWTEADYAVQRVAAAAALAAVSSAAENGDQP